MLGCSKAVIGACEKSSMWQLALDLLYMPAARVMRLGKLRRALCVIYRTWSHVRNTGSYNGAISSCGKGLAWTASLMLLEELATLLNWNDALRSGVRALSPGRVLGCSGLVQYLSFLNA